jgi:hypothetical protein
MGDLQPTCRRDSSELTRRLGRRAAAGPRQVLAGVGRRINDDAVTGRANIRVLYCPARLQR